jgi:hypothetical protein
MAEEEKTAQEVPSNKWGVLSTYHKFFFPLVFLDKQRGKNIVHAAESRKIAR